MLILKNCAPSPTNGASVSINNSPWVCATVPKYYRKICLYSLSVYTQYVFTLITFCMSQNALGQKILMSSNRFSPASIRMGSRSTPESHALSPTNLNIWIITSLVTVLWPYQIKSRSFKPSQPQRHANNCVSSLVWSTSIVTCGKKSPRFLPH